MRHEEENKISLHKPGCIFGKNTCKSNKDLTSGSQTFIYSMYVLYIYIFHVPIRTYSKLHFIQGFSACSCEPGKSAPSTPKTIHQPGRPRESLRSQVHTIASGHSAAKFHTAPLIWVCPDFPITLTSGTVELRSNAECLTLGKSFFNSILLLMYDKSPTCRRITLSKWLVTTL